LFEILANKITKTRTGVNDGARTRDIPDHNRMLYQLSYIHHVFESRISDWRSLSALRRD
jgi:hypothetical protein